MTWQVVSFRPTRDLHEHVLFNVLNTSFEDRLQLRVSGSFLRSAKVLSELEEHHVQAIRLLPLMGTNRISDILVEGGSNPTQH